MTKPKAQPLLSREDRLRLFDDIRSRTRPTTEDSTDLIRKDRDGAEAEPSVEKRTPSPGEGGR